MIMYLAGQEDYKSPLAFFENLYYLLALTGFIFFGYYTTLFQVELIRPIPLNEGGRNNEQYARKEPHADRRSLVLCRTPSAPALV
jgi:hypothetical protein